MHGSVSIDHGTAIIIVLFERGLAQAHPTNAPCEATDIQWNPSIVDTLGT